jgi:hypothetical protein
MRPACCNTSYAPVVVLTASEIIDLDGFACGGDESRMCCNAPVFGQAVIATGRLERYGGMDPRAKWTLVGAELCLDN